VVVVMHLVCWVVGGLRVEGWSFFSFSGYSGFVVVPTVLVLDLELLVLLVFHYPSSSPKIRFWVCYVWTV
jgi:hypothetical protein